MTRFLLMMIIALLPQLASAQSEPRGTVPPGSASDGSRPADGAIKGGTILPGERGGMPQSSSTPEQRIARCNEMSGTLRDECLRRERNSSTGGSSDLYGPKSTPPSAPPPQNPR